MLAVFFFNRKVAMFSLNYSFANIINKILHKNVVHNDE